MAIISIDNFSNKGKSGIGMIVGLNDAFSSINSSPMTNSQNSINELKKNIGSIMSIIDDASIENDVISAYIEQCELNSALSFAYNEIDSFIENTRNIENNVRTTIENLKKDFYAKNPYLKPESEKKLYEKIRDRISAGAEWLWDKGCNIVSAVKNFYIDVGNFCKKHWKAIATVVLVVVSVVLLATGVGSVLAGACWGAIMGAVIGGVSGGIESVSNGGSFWEGVENGAFSGAISGAVSGAIGGGIGRAGAALGKGKDCKSIFGMIIKGSARISQVTSTMMAGFDTVSLADKAIGPGFISKLNEDLHKKPIYNVVQVGVSMWAVFSGGVTTTMKCFVAGTLILAMNGVTPIEQIHEGDYVLSYNPINSKTEYKRVVKTYVRTTNSLCRLVINGEELLTTPEHPFFSKEYGFIEAAGLESSSSVYNQTLSESIVTSVSLLSVNETKVYNFQVEDYHTYFVGECGILVHNANSDYKGSNIPVPNKTEASNGLTYQSNPKHTPGGAGNGPKAGIEPNNSLKLFENSIPSSKKVGVRFAYDEQTKTLHRFFSNKSGTEWHWTGSTNQGANSLSSNQVPKDVLRQFGINPKGW